MIEATDSNFSDIISKGTFLVDFYTHTCGPCRTLSMILTKAEQEINAMGVDIVKVDIESCSDMANRFGVSAVPTVQIVTDGEYVGGFIGMRTKKQIIETIEEAVR